MYNNIENQALSLINELSSLEGAFDIALQAHHGQKRKVSGLPYVTHPVRVKNVAKELGYGKDVQLVALLHDTIEDSKGKMYDEVISLINRQFKKKPEILQSVLYLTHDKNIPYEDYLIKLFVGSLSDKKAQDIAKKVKICDMISNLRDNPSEKQSLKYINAIKKLISLEIPIPKELSRYASKILSESKKPFLEADNPFASDSGGGDAGEKDAGGGDNPFGGGGDAGGGDNPFGGGGDAGGGDNPFGGGGDAGGDDAGGGDAEGGGEDKEKQKITFYNEKLKKQKLIKFQRMQEEPGMDFMHFNNFVKDNYISKTKNGGLMLPVPSEVKTGKLFLNKVAIPYLNKFIRDGFEHNKSIIVLTNTTDETLRYLNTNCFHKYGNQIKVLRWDTLYDNDIAKELKKRTGVVDEKIKAAIGLFFNGSGFLSSKGGTEISDVIKDWEIYSDSSDKDIERLFYPEYFNNAENEASFIIKVYLHLLRAKFLQKVVQLERSGKIVIAPVDKFTAWQMYDSFKKAPDILKAKAEELALKRKEEKEKETPEEETPEKGKEKTAEKGKEKEETPEKGKEKTAEKGKEKTTEKPEKSDTKEKEKNENPFLK